MRIYVVVPRRLLTIMLPKPRSLNPGLVIMPHEAESLSWMLVILSSRPSPLKQSKKVYMQIEVDKAVI